MDQSQSLPIVIIFVIYITLIIFILNLVNFANVYSVIIFFTFILIILITLLLILYTEINAAQFPTIETKKLNAEEAVNIALIHNILIKKGLKLEQLENNKKEFVNLCITHKFSFDDEKIMHIFNTLNNINVENISEVY